MPKHFPPLTPEMQQHGQAVLKRLREEIKTAGGCLSFARFMELSLYAPGLGYYSAGSHKLGAQGDFVTAPEISPLFAKCLARSFADIITALPEADILEIGAGSGIFAKELLLEMQLLKTLPAHYYILETSAELRQRQHTLLKQHCPLLFPRLVWLDRLPEQFKGIIFANEVLDALPLHCFRIENNQVLERGVGFDNEQLLWRLRPPQEVELERKLQDLMNMYHLEEGYESEINLILPQWIKTLARVLQQGLLIFFDYGYGRKEYYHPQRHKGSLRCFFQHRVHQDPFFLPGLQDITANVDFTTVVEAGVNAGLELLGYTTQSAFLMDCGIADLLETSPTSMQQYQQNQALKLLMLPSEMGTLVKALGLAKGWDKPVKGFSLIDRRGEL